MTRADWIEVAAVAVAAAASWWLPEFLPATMALWQIILGLSALLLAQSLVRDVTILLRRRRAESSGPPKVAQCFCLESTVGATGVIAGAALAGLGGSNQIAISGWGISLAATGTLVLGFLLKDWVISWRPPGLRREKDHLNLIVRWK